MADEDVKIKDLPRTESVNDDDDVVIEDAAPTTYRIHASDLRSYVAKSVQDSIDQMEKEITANTNAITENTNNIQTNKESISELNTSLADLLKVQSFTSETYSVNASSNTTASIDISLDGYTPLGIVTWTNDGSGTSNLNVYGIMMDSAKTTISYAVRNIGSSTVSSFAAKITVLYMKNI